MGKESETKCQYELYTNEWGKLNKQLERRRSSSNQGNNTTPTERDDKAARGHGVRTLFGAPCRAPGGGPRRTGLGHGRTQARDCRVTLLKFLVSYNWVGDSKRRVWR